MALKRIVSTPHLIVDQYDAFAWVTCYTSEPPGEDLARDLQGQGVTHAARIYKPKKGLPENSVPWFGAVPQYFSVSENGITFEVRCLETRHPGLFLDHQLTRSWLKNNARGQSVLNLFSFTGSLAIAAAVGGASRSVSVDLSNPATLWARKNAELNHLSESHQFIKADVFDYLQRRSKQQETFDIVISDPPSHATSDLLRFSTEKHLDDLHRLCIPKVASRGVLLTSINTEALGQEVLTASCMNVAKSMGRHVRRCEYLPLPSGFDLNFRAMKGLRIFFED